MKRLERLAGIVESKSISQQQQNVDQIAANAQQIASDAQQIEANGQQIIANGQQVEALVEASRTQPCRYHWQQLKD